MALSAVTGQNIGNIYPAMQSGTITLSAGVAVVQFAQPFKTTPMFMATPLTQTGGSLIPPSLAISGVTTTQASITGWEWTGLVGTAGTISGTISAAQVSWFAFATQRGN